jgi:hypothetical protein
MRGRKGEKGWKQKISTAANDLELRMKLVRGTEKRSPKWPRYTRDPADGDPEDGSGKAPVGKPGPFVNGQQHRRSGTRRAGRHWRIESDSPPVVQQKQQQQRAVMDTLRVRSTVHLAITARELGEGVSKKRRWFWVAARHGSPATTVAFRPRNMLSILRSLKVKTTQGVSLVGAGPAHGPKAGVRDVVQGTKLVSHAKVEGTPR